MVPDSSEFITLYPRLQQGIRRVPALGLTGEIKKITKFLPFVLHFSRNLKAIVVGE